MSGCAGGFWPRTEAGVPGGHASGGAERRRALSGGSWTVDAGKVNGGKALTGNAGRQQST